ncbi:MAG TPA: hypothetical protein VGM92_08850 [Candidatus Kapabacteria bacterium]
MIHRKAFFPILAGIAIAAALWPWRMSFPFDDAYITFRYAEHLAHGYGLVWNTTGPHTEGYTNFLQVLFLSPFAAQGTDLMIVSQLIGIAATILTAFILYRFLYFATKSDAYSIAGSFLYLLQPFTWANAFSGLETTLFVLLVTAAFYYNAKKDWRAAFLFSSLATLARPEGALVGMIIAASILLEPRTLRMSAIRMMVLYLILPMAFYASFKWWYFGDLLPNSFYIKTGEHGFHGLLNTKWFLRGNLIFLALALYTLWRRPSGWKLFLPILAWSVSLILFYLWPEPLQGFYFRFDWAAVPALILLTVFLVSKTQWSWRPAALFGFIAIAQIVFNMKHMREEMSLATLEKGRDIYYELGMALRSMPDHERMSFAYQDAGAVPYYSEMQHVDLVGLNTTAIATCDSVEDACRILEKIEPDIILIPAYRNNTECWSVFQDAHGKARELTPALVHHPMMNAYVCVGYIRYLGYDILCYTLPKCTPLFANAVKVYPWFVPGAVCVE